MTAFFRCSLVVAFGLSAAAQTYAPAKVGTCRTRFGYGIITTTGGDCRRMGGGMNGTPGDAEWTSCHLDWCSRGGSPAYTASRPGSCPTKVGSGVLKTTAADCRRMGGAMNGTPGDGEWTDCHLDWCATTTAAAVRTPPA